ncbi:MAG: hypothetical protein LBH10_04480, partial [Burkholderiaceae bacterium]|nr:hypothetical protein [Burkholderiaceae bacterium]
DQTPKRKSGKSGKSARKSPDPDAKASARPVTKAASRKDGARAGRASKKGRATGAIKRAGSSARKS